MVKELDVNDLKEKEDVFFLKQRIAHRVQNAVVKFMRYTAQKQDFDVTNINYYGYFMNYVVRKFVVNGDTNEKGLPKVDTAAVCVFKNELTMIFNCNFCDKLNDEELAGIILHELKHLLHSHLSRGKNHKNKMLANIVMDVCVNESIMAEKQKGLDFIDLPSNCYLLEGLVKLASSITKKEEMYTGSLIFEHLYDYIQNLLGDINLPKDSSFGNQFDDHFMDGEGETEIPSDLMDEKLVGIDRAVKEAMNRATGNGRGYTAGGSDFSLGEVRKSPTNYVEKLTTFINSSTYYGKLQDDVAKRRRRDCELWGRRKQGERVINVILDVSGSMFDGSIETVIGEIFSRNFLVNYILCDAQVQSHQKVHSRKILNVRYRGQGGTVLQPAIDYVVNNTEISKYNTVILTDGYCDDFDFSTYKGRVLILYTGVEPKYSNHSQVQVVKVSKEYNKKY